jgi:hypothetical protein
MALFSVSACAPPPTCRSKAKHLHPGTSKSDGESPRASNDDAVLAEVLAAALGGDTPGTGSDDGSSERRVHPRTPLRIAVRVHEVKREEDGTEAGVWDDGDAATTIDIGRSGIGVASRRVYETGVGILILVQRKWKSPLVLAGRVAYVRAMPAGAASAGHVYHVGVSFEPLARDPLVAAWIARQGGQAAESDQSASRS